MCLLSFCLHRLRIPKIWAEFPWLTKKVRVRVVGLGLSGGGFLQSNSYINLALLIKLTQQNQLNYHKTTSKYTVAEASKLMLFLCFTSDNNIV